MAVTDSVPVAASATLRTISWVAAPCSSTAAAMELAMPLISRMRPAMPSMAWTAWPVEPWIWAIWAEISAVALAVWSASAFTSVATTAKPRPATPARAASIVAFSASRLVWLAIAEIRSTTSPTRRAPVLRAWTRSAVAAASRTAACARSAEEPTWRPISLTEEPSSSAAAATVVTLEEASSAAAAALVDWPAVCVAVAVRLWAVDWSCVAADVTEPTMPPMADSNRSASSRVACRRCASAPARACAVSASRARACSRFSRKTATVADMAPISSRRAA